MTHAQLTTEALGLPDDDKAKLAFELLRSLADAPGGAFADDQEDWDRSWARELERRMAAIDAGAATMVPAEAVFAELREHMKRER